MIALCDLLASVLSEELSCGQKSNLDWASLSKLASFTKTVGIVRYAVDKAGLDIPDAIRAEFKAVKAQTLAKNFQNLASTLQVVEILEQADIPCLAYKGAVRSFGVYKKWDMRTSADIDILVKPSDYEAARKTLKANGYLNIVSPLSDWWHVHLGESPYVRSDRVGPIVDLHHRLQQPGGPFPAYEEDFFTEAVTVEFGSRSLKTLSPEDSMLLTAISYGKALRSGSPWLKEAHEIASVYSSANASERQKFLTRAQRQGLSRLYRQALGNSLALFDINDGEAFASGDKSELLHLAFGKQNHHHFFRSQQLWGWLDGNFVTRCTKLIGGLLRVSRSERARLREERSGIIKMSRPTIEQRQGA